MQKQPWIKTSKCVVGIAAVPVLLWAYSTGPDAHKTGVPAPGGAEPTCVACHLGTALNGGGGNVTLTAAGGTSYTPGQKQTLTIAVTDSAAKVYGFEMTARLASDLNQQAGSFTAGASQQIKCASPSVTDAGSATCGGTRTLEFIEHTQPLQSSTITVDWTPPSTASGAIAIYVSANAANGNGSNSGDHIYNTSITLQPASTAPTPTISDGGIVSAAAFGGAKGVAPGTWLEIYGTNLSTTTGEWSGSDFQGTAAPTKLGGVTVTVAGKNAFVRYISPGQVNVQAPDDIGTGPVPVVVTNENGSSNAANITATAQLPGLLAPFGNGYVAAFQGSTVVGSPSFAAVKPGDVIVLYGIGFGAVTPTISAGQIAQATNTVTTPLKIMIGGAEAAASYQGLGPTFVGLYQFNVTVPNVSDGDQPVTVDLGGQGTGQTIKIAVKK
jgi:uncharacterized protein (TIGR03437 family)